MVLWLQKKKISLQNIGSGISTKKRFVSLWFNWNTYLSEIYPKGFERMWKFAAILLLAALCVNAEDEHSNNGKSLS